MFGLFFSSYPNQSTNPSYPAVRDLILHVLMRLVTLQAEDKFGMWSHSDSTHAVKTLAHSATRGAGGGQVEAGDGGSHSVVGLFLFIPMGLRVKRAIV